VVLEGESPGGFSEMRFGAFPGNSGVAASSESPSVKGRTGAAAYTIAAGQYL